MVSSTGDHVYVTFISDEMVAFNGFRLEWIVHGKKHTYDSKYTLVKKQIQPMKNYFNKQKKKSLTF